MDENTIEPKGMGLPLVLVGMNWVSFALLAGPDNLAVRFKLMEREERQMVLNAMLQLSQIVEGVGTVMGQNMGIVAPPSGLVLP